MEIAKHSSAAGNGTETGSLEIDDGPRCTIRVAERLAVEPEVGLDGLEVLGKETIDVSEDVAFQLVSERLKGGVGWRVWRGCRRHRIRCACYPMNLLASIASVGNSCRQTSKEIGGKTWCQSRTYRHGLRPNLLQKHTRVAQQGRSRAGVGIKSDHQGMEGKGGEQVFYICVCVYLTFFSGHALSRAPLAGTTKRNAHFTC